MFQALTYNGRRVQRCPQGSYRNEADDRKEPPLYGMVSAQCTMETGSGDIYLNPCRQWK